MQINDLEKMLIKSLVDFKLDQDEKVILKNLAQSLEPDQLNFIRNKSFELTRNIVGQSASEAMMAYNWLEKVIKAIQIVAPSNGIKSEAFFSPGEDCKNKIIHLISHAKRQIKICVFTISDNTITQAIVDAHNRGIHIAIISDNDKSNDKGSDIEFLSKKGVSVILDHAPSHMHHKFAIFDEQILLSGSFNWTRSATTSNQENILVTGDKGLITAFDRKFEQLLSQFTKNH